MIKVSIVVPVFNAGAFIQRCAPSLLGQTLDAESFEIIYVDDGSTDDSAESLDRLAAKHPQVRVIRQENSGWPGKPRNVGVRQARGEYIQFVDQDDRLMPDALERLYALANRCGSDIVMGRVTGTMAGPSNIFKRTVERCTIADAPLMESLSPHKMFRRAFLLEHGIEFPEGRVRLEDQLFMARAYVRAKTVSILGGRPCYVWDRRADGGNTSSTATTPEIYYGSLREVIDAIKQCTEPGALQDYLLRRSYRVELLRPVTEPQVLQRKGTHLQHYFDVVRRTALECYPPGVRDGLPAVSRLRATLLEEGRLDSMIELARRVRRVTPHLRIDDLSWRDGRLVLRATIDMRLPSGKPLTLVDRYGRLVLDPRLTDGIEGAAEFPVPYPLAYAYGELFVHDVSRDLWWYPDADLTPRTEPLGGGLHRVVVSGETVIDPLRLADNTPLPPGTYEVWAYGQLLGIGRRARPVPEAVARRRQRALPAVAVGDPAWAVVPGWSDTYEQLTITVGDQIRSEALFRATHHPRVRHAARNLVSTLPSGLRGSAQTLAGKTEAWTRR